MRLRVIRGEEDAPSGRQVVLQANAECCPIEGMDDAIRIEGDECAVDIRIVAGRRVGLLGILQGGELRAATRGDQIGDTRAPHEGAGEREAVAAVVLASGGNDRDESINGYAPTRGAVRVARGWRRKSV